MLAQTMSAWQAGLRRCKAFKSDEQTLKAAALVSAQMSLFPDVKVL